MTPAESLDSASPLLAHVTEWEGLTLVRFEGTLDEHNRLATRIPPGAAGRTLVIHLARLELINSSGVRDWVRWLQSLEQAGDAVYLTHCSPMVMNQINRVRNFCGGSARLVSFFAPYYCANCDREQRELISMVDGLPVLGPPEAVCESCGEPVEFDDVPDAYFAATATAKPPVPKSVVEAIGHFQQAELKSRAAELKEISTGRKTGTPGPGSDGR